MFKAFLTCILSSQINAISISLKPVAIHDSEVWPHKISSVFDWRYFYPIDLSRGISTVIPLSPIILPLFRRVPPKYGNLYLHLPVMVSLGFLELIANWMYCNTNTYGKLARELWLHTFLAHFFYWYNSGLPTACFGNGVCSSLPSVVKCFKPLLPQKGQVRIPDPLVTLAVDGSPLTSGSLPRLARWDLVRFHSTLSFRVRIAISLSVL